MHKNFKLNFIIFANFPKKSLKEQIEEAKQKLESENKNKIINNKKEKSLKI